MKDYWFFLNFAPKLFKNGVLVPDFALLVENYFLTAQNLGGRNHFPASPSSTVTPLVPLSEKVCFC